jgi:polar amino acid transport system substrate-binding protein
MGNEIVGYEMAILDAFCREKGYALEVEDLEFSAIMVALQAGKFDLGSASFTVTPERMESSLFTEPTYQGSVAVIVRKTGEAAQPSFWESLSASFNKTFIRESRWRLFADGIRNTLLITLLSVFFGTLLGFIMYLPCRKANPIANTITRIAVWLVEGLPMVVLLMVLYYLVFASVAISGIAVAVIGFTLTFGSAVFGMLKMGVGAVDRGQMEAASALGFGDWHAFFGLILPQAMPHMLPSYKGAIAALIKETSIVGYIAVQDLTKMGDIVRSRTYDAFFPLIAVSLIYFILAAIINWIIGRLLNRTNPKRKNRAGLLKGVNVHD